MVWVEIMHQKLLLEGVVQALKEYNDLEFFITGPEDIIKEELR